MNRRSFVKTTSVMAAAAIQPGILAQGAGTPGLERQARRRLVFPGDEIRLFANENPYGPPSAALAAMRDGLAFANRYGSYGTGGALIEPADIALVIAEREDVPSDHVLVTHGATELLQLCPVAYGVDGVGAQLPTYGPILGYTSALGRRVHMSRVAEDYHYDFESLRRATSGRSSLVYLCHPNNPTGLVESLDQIEGFCREAAEDAVVAVDEAYHEYVSDTAYRSMIPLVQEGVDVIVLRTFSKAYGLAGMRIGYAIARPDLLTPLRRLQVGAINVVGLLGARAALGATGFLERTRKRTASTRARLQRALDDIGVRSLPSATNFVMVDARQPAAEALVSLREKGVRVNSTIQRDSSWLRVTIGTDEEMDAFLAAFRHVIG